jgi:arylsulfatase A-like enzyme
MRRVVMMVVDGLRGDMLTAGYTPRLAELAARSRRCVRHRCAFPSATRVNSASIATGCHPGRHGLSGNAIALDEGNGLVAVSVGPPEFRERWRRATGSTLSVPTLSERLRHHGGVLIHSNSSAGAAHMQDPDGHGTLLHRSGSHGPGLRPITGSRHPAVGYDADGDAEVTRRFCTELETHPAPLSVLWICEPDHSQHVLELGSAAHREVLTGADRCVGEVVEAVRALRASGDDVLLMVCSDHGHETATSVVPVQQLMQDAGLLRGLQEGDVVLASSGMGALVFASEHGQARCARIAAWLARQSWCDAVHIAAELPRVGLAARDGLCIAFAMAKSEAANRFGIPGCGAVAEDPFSSHDTPGHGQHGGLGAWETNPCLVIDGPDITPMVDPRPTHAVDLAPTALAFLGQSTGGMDGRPLL